MTLCEDLTVLSHLYSQQLFAIVIPILQMRKLRLREVRKLAQGSTTIKTSLAHKTSTLCTIPELGLESTILLIAILLAFAYHFTVYKGSLD